MEQNPLSVPSAVLWTAAYVGVMLVYTGLDVAVWRKWFPGRSEWIGLAAAAACSAGFLWLVQRRRPVDVFSGVTPTGLLLAAACSLLFFLLLDCCLDPLLERAFPRSEAAYQEALEHLAGAPAASLLRICLLAPVVEEILMRGLVLGGLRDSCGVLGALLLSSLLPLSVCAVPFPHPAVIAAAIAATSNKLTTFFFISALSFNPLKFGLKFMFLSLQLIF